MDSIQTIHTKMLYMSKPYIPGNISKIEYTI